MGVQATRGPKQPSRAQETHQAIDIHGFGDTSSCSHLCSCIPRVRRKSSSELSAENNRLVKKGLKRLEVVSDQMVARLTANMSVTRRPNNVNELWLVRQFSNLFFVLDQYQRKPQTDCEQQYNRFTE